ncbi:hypothetical protein [Mesomycoplasma neurolyticum]|uniref:Uncharacterized protein n=1 Tax=Mesomycoplasma neurolyticum TaxID=2120 RepID=A0A449A5S7_9BACT|nr:hypothetical protein [Mesomycoplasma neurolyticum]VEU59611.1 Uncharacterised protein [Mesomycoplasma neurolyticum]
MRNQIKNINIAFFVLIIISIVLIVISNILIANIATTIYDYNVKSITSTFIITILIFMIFIAMLVLAIILAVKSQKFDITIFILWIISSIFLGINLFFLWIPIFNIIGAVFLILPLVTTSITLYKTNKEKLK